MASERLTYLWAAEQVIREHRRPLSAAEIVTFAQARGIFSDAMYSRTPQKSMQARLSMEIVRKKEGSMFVRTAKGRFYLRELLSPFNDYHVMPVAGPEVPALTVYTAPRRAPATPRERVLAIPRSRFEPILTFQGLRRDDGKLVSRLTRGALDYLPRTIAESTEDYKQLVTYVLITCGHRVLAFERGSFSRVAEFLRGSLCIGFGGHVREEDRTLFSYLDAGVFENALRELTEELSANELPRSQNASRLKIVGVINDDSSEVGRRHVAVVLRYSVDDWNKWRKVSRGEASVTKLRWLDTRRDLVDLGQYEYWSQLCWREFFPDVVRTQPVYRIFRKKPFRNKHIVVIVGGIGSGKSLATRYFSQRLGYAEINSGKIVAKLLGVRPVPVTSRTRFQNLAWQFISHAHGPETLAVALLKAAREADDRRVVIDGVRHRATLEAIKKFSEVPIAVLYVHAAPDTAFEFYKRREHTGKVVISPRRFLDLLNGPTERDIPHLMATADAVLYNWTGVAKFNEALHDMATDLDLKQR